MGLEMPNAPAGAARTVERDRHVPELEGCVVWPRQQMPAAQRRSAEAGADREVHQVVDAASGSEGSLAQDRHLRIVLEEDWEPQRGADRPREIRAREARPEVRRLHGYAGPRIQRSRRTDADTHEARHSGGIFLGGVLSCALQRGDAGSHHGGGSIGDRRWCRSAAEPCSIRTHQRSSNLRATEVEREHRCVGGRLCHLKLRSLAVVRGRDALVDNVRVTCG